MSASAVVNSEVLYELGQSFFGEKYCKTVKSALSSHGFAPIPVYSSLLIELDEILSNFVVIMVDSNQVQVKKYIFPSQKFS